MSEFTSGRTFTTSELRDATGYSAPSISRLALQSGFGTVVPAKTGTDSVWPLEFYMWLKKHKARIDLEHQRIAKRKAKLVEEENKNIAEMKREHPLVTDERCFKLNYWPETVPNCLEDFIGE